MRFLWYNEKGELEVFRFTRVPFGAGPSPFLLNATLKHHLEKLVDDQSLLSLLLQSLYVDDILKSVSNISEAKKLMHEVELILMSGGFRIKHWILFGHSGSLENEDHDIKIADVTEGSVLSMVWKPKEDVFNFQQTCHNIHATDKLCL